MNKNLILGTAGHVDHGKTSLIKMLTGFDCDTHKQEKTRGITINLGFTHLDLPNGNSLGIVDVPGHKDFVNTMISGANGIDFVMLVIAADDGIMPQTREHMMIMEHLGIQKGLIALTKIDLIDDELLELAKLEIAEFIEGTFLQDCPIVPVSSLSKKGKNLLLEELMKLSDSIEPKKESGNFRMYIDRIFTVKGFGTVVNGSALSGKLTLDDKIYLEPGSKELRIRGLEHHGEKVNSVSSGSRVSINVVGMQKDDFEKGMVISSKPLHSTELIDVKLKIIDENTNFGIWNHAIFLLGTIKLNVKLHLLDKDSLAYQEEGLAQIYLPKKIVAIIGDKFILRSTSGDKTISAGEIIDPHPLHHRRRRKTQIDCVQKIAEGGLKQLIEVEVKKSLDPISINQIAQNLNLETEQIFAFCQKNTFEQLKSYQVSDDIVFLTKQKNAEIRKKIISSLKKFHKDNPFNSNGLMANQLLGVFHSKSNFMKKVLEAILENLSENNLISNINKTWILANHKVEVDKNTLEQIYIVENIIASHKNIVLEFSSFTDERLSEDLLKKIISHLKTEKKIIYSKGKFVYQKTFDQIFLKVIDFIKKNNEIKVTDLRDLLSSNRKNAIEFLEFLDDLGLTIRRGDKRIITKKGLEEAKSIETKLEH